ncbi:MAG: VCBS repeat-containing protein [Planctomycetes bacterium]|nr:VCBS repeat-containing protein [Planctomycetota bacterium]
MRRLFTWSLAAIAIILVSPAAVLGTSFVRGDANVDGMVDLSDAVTVLGVLFLGTPGTVPCQDALDADDSSGQLEITDAVYLLQFLFSGGSPPPAPYPDCGLDPTADGVTCYGYPPCAARLFAPPTSYRAGDGPVALAQGDLDGDGALDLAVADSPRGAASILLGRGDGTFARAVSYPAGAEPGAVALGDLNGDGALDLVAANRAFRGGTQGFSVLLGQGDGTFSGAATRAAGSRPESAALGDLDRDGALDLALAGGSGAVSVLLGRGDGTFGDARDHRAGVHARSAALGDLDRDGVPDLAVADVSSVTESVWILLGLGDGDFAEAVAYPAPGNPFAVAVADLDGDVALDLAVAGGGAWVLLGRGDGTFPRADRYPTGPGPVDVAVADVSGDGTPDLAVASLASSTVSVLLGRGDGTFVDAVGYVAGERPDSIAAGDLNADGTADLAVTNAIRGTVSLLLSVR